VSEAKTILGISGSARRNSFNTALLRAAAARMPEGFRLEITGIRGIPIYDGDLEAEQGIPEAAQKLKEQAAAGVNGRTIVRVNKQGDIEVRRPTGWDVIGGLLGDFDERVRRETGLDWA
jgi:hypothetical protein